VPGLEVLGKWVALVGLALAVIGGLLWLVGRVFPQISQLPGTIKMEGAGFSCVFPLLASIVLSVVLTVVLNIIARFINR
jgi:hypothetical protein